MFKKAWAGLFFGSGGATATPSGFGSGTGSTARHRRRGLARCDRAANDPACGRFAADVCGAYLSIATDRRGHTGRHRAARRSSPAGVLDQIKAPTLLIQGEADSLFPLTEADANARGHRRERHAVRVAWFTGGHDGGAGPQSDQDRLNYLTDQWLDHYLKGTGATPRTRSPTPGSPASTRTPTASSRWPSTYRRTRASAVSRTTQVAVAGPPQPAANPPGGTPAAISSLPGAGGGGVASFVRGVVTDVPGQHADFYSAPLPQSVDVVGSPTVLIQVASPTGDGGPLRQAVRRRPDRRPDAARRAGRAGPADRPADHASTRRSR